MRVALLVIAGLVVAGGAVTIIRPFAKTDRGYLDYEGHWMKPTATPIPVVSKTTCLCPVGNDYVAVRTQGGLAIFDAKTGALIRRFTVEGGAGLTGITSNGTTVWVSGARDTVSEVDLKGTVLRTLHLPKPAVGGDPYPAGLALSADAKTLFVCSNRGNEVVSFNLSTGEVAHRFPVDPAPYDLAMTRHDNEPGFVVTCWSRAPQGNERTSKSSDTSVPTTPNGIGEGGTVRFFAASGSVTDSHPTGLQPTQIISPAPEKRVYIASNQDELVVDLNDTEHKAVKLPQLSIPNGISYDSVAKRYYVACAGTNQIRAYDENLAYLGCIHTSDCPTGVLVHQGRLWVCTSKGLGAQVNPRKSYSSYNFSGDVMSLPVPTLAQLQEGEKNKPGVIDSPKTFPFKKGTIEHVVYILKENRTYDQVFGDMKAGDGDKSLCNFPERVTPNQHALARQFGLLDNYYCNGVLSADGHSWAMEGSATTYLERGFGGWTRSYPYGGDDALAVSYTGYIWEPVVKAGKSFRNFGEFDTASTVPANASWKEIYDDFIAGTHKIKITHNWGTSDIDKYSDPNAPGWNLNIPDVLRAQVFLDALEKYNATGTMPNFTIIYLPQDHTMGMSKGGPRPESMVADNDIAVGHIVDAISHSKFWAKTAIFVNEDDPQAGVDHVDGHRSTCLVISPYTKHGQTISNFYNQNSVNRTILALLGLPPLHTRMAAAPLMANCFTAQPDMSPFTMLENQIPIDNLVSLSNPLTKLSATLRLKGPDESDPVLLDRIIWSATKPGTSYPVALAGPHGRGLASKGLQLEAAASNKEESDDESGK